MVTSGQWARFAANGQSGPHTSDHVTLGQMMPFLLVRQFLVFSFCYLPTLVVALISNGRTTEDADRNSQEIIFIYSSYMTSTRNLNLNFFFFYWFGRRNSHSYQRLIFCFRSYTLLIPMSSNRVWENFNYLSQHQHVTSIKLGHDCR